MRRNGVANGGDDVVNGAGAWIVISDTCYLKPKTIYSGVAPENIVKSLCSLAPSVARYAPGAGDYGCLATKITSTQ